MLTSREGSQLGQAGKKKKLFTLKVFTAGSGPTGTRELWETAVTSQLPQSLGRCCLLFVCLFNFSDKSKWATCLCIFLIWAETQSLKMG